MSNMSVASSYNAYPVQSVNTQSYNPYTTTPVVGDDSGSGFGTDFTSISSKLSAGAGGGFAAYKLGGQMSGNIKGMFGNGFKGFLGGAKNVAITGVKGAGLSALVGAGVSAVANGVGVATGKVESSEAVSNVIGDTIGSAVGGLGAVTLGGIGHMALSKFGVAGMGLTIATTALGAVGGVAASFAKDAVMGE
jgi:hypothetical protein